MKTFAIIGAAGFVAPRHLQAIKETGNDLVAALDPFDSVGILDSYFPEAAFFTEFERFDRHLEKRRREGKSLDFLTICSPNYLHDAHIRFGLRHGADVICEKPLVLNPWNVDALSEIEAETGHRIYSILQLRLHPAVDELKNAVAAASPDKVFDVELRYITSRGSWYHYSWKGDIDKSGGIATNIGIHFFDMLLWVFGEVEENLVEVHLPNKASGTLKLKRANVNWLLSIDENDLPDDVKGQGSRTFRSIVIDGQEFEFSEGFGDLHTVSYQKILAGEGFGLTETRRAIDLAHLIRNH